MCETVRDILNKQDYWQHCIKIDNALNEVLDPNRALWEMVQNARDLSKQQCKIKITLSNEKLTFAHNGECFNFESLTSLIKQVSTCDKRTSQDEYAGRFGTGFLETHSFNRVFTINGSYQTLKGQYISLDDFEINRDYSDINTLFSQMQSEIKKAEQFENNEVEYVARKEYTEFSFVLLGTAKNQAIKAFNKFSEMVPYVMVFNSRISEITLIDKIEGRDIVFERGETKNEIDGLLSTKIISNGSGQLYYYLQLLDGDSKIIMPFYSTSQGMNIELLPKLFCYFPLLGTEKFGLQFIFNSSKFEPKEKRNGILLPDCNNKKTKELAATNVDLIEKLSDVALDYLGKNIENINDVIEFANIEFSSNVGDELSNESKVFFEELKHKWVSRFKRFKIVETDKGRFSVSDSDNVRFFDGNIIAFLNREGNKEKYLDALHYFAGKVSNLPKKDEIIKWSTIVQHWGCIDDKLISLKQICDKVEYDAIHLHSFLELVKSMDNSSDMLFENYALIPNREFELHRKSELRRVDDSISTVLYKAARKISRDITNKFVDKQYADICDLNSYSRDDLRKDVNDAIGKNRDKNILFDDEFEKALFNYCSVFYNGSADLIRIKLMPVFAGCLGYEFIEQRICSKSTEEGDLFETPFYNLCEQVCYRISQWENVSDDIGKINILKQFFDKIKNANKIKDIVIKYSVFPNMKGNLCKTDKLYMLEEYDNVLLDIYKEATGKDIRDIIVDSKFKTFWEFNKYELINIGKEIEDSLDVKNANEVTNVTLKIIENLDNDKWEGIFSYIEEHKAELFFKKVQGKNKDSVYKIMKVDNSECLQLLAELSSDANRLIRAKELLEAEDQKNADLQYKKLMGDRIEKLLQNKLAEELDEFEIEVKPTVKNIQDGQDLIVYCNKEAVYYIEVKSKWSFEKDPYAHMSKNQMSKSKEKNDCYALCCVNLSDIKVEDKYNLGIDTVISNTSVHLHIGDTFGEFLIAMNEVDGHLEKNGISMNVDYNCNIPKSKFTSGQPFEELISVIVDKIHNVESR